MGTFYSQFDYVEDYKFSFGRYKGRTLEEIIDQDDCIEYLKWIRKKLKTEIKNPRKDKYIGYNKRGLAEVEDFLIAAGTNIEKTDFTNIDCDTEVQNSSNDLQTDSISDINNASEYTNIQTANFKELIELFNEKILDNFDEKFQSVKYIKMEYRDYLCLRYSKKLYLQILENQDTDSLKIVLSNMK